MKQKHPEHRSIRPFMRPWETSFQSRCGRGIRGLARMIPPRLKATGSLPVSQAPSTRKPSSGLDRDTMSQP
ncbi:hypothetical protein HMPREF0185_03254 [Brevundimonas diminuta 470-4]|nr:hypothetical protein HMPREF0185_03254 [Brevundimonas diminuta 470-4]